MKVEVKRNEPRNCWNMVNLLWQCLGFGSNPVFGNQNQTAKPHLPQPIRLRDAERIAIFVYLSWRSCCCSCLWPIWWPIERAQKTFWFRENAGGHLPVFHLGKKKLHDSSSSSSDVGGGEKYQYVIEADVSVFGTVLLHNCWVRLWNECVRSGVVQLPRGVAS